MNTINVLAALPDGFKIFGLHIQFYAIFILFGALMALLLASFRFSKDGYDFNIMENVFYVAFPAGIVGARIWYVIAEWDSFVGRDFWAPFRIWEGGLAIQGGAALGILAGALCVKFWHKNLKLLYAVDNCVPGILVAQAIGRIGNFFNQEVYGAYVSSSSWSFLPNFILEQMHCGAAGPGQIAVPLFLVEALINLTGFFVLAYIMRWVMGRFRQNGDISFAYFIWYGLTRIIMEPLRNPTYIMGNEEFGSSLIMAIIYVVIGVVAIFLNHFIRYMNKRQKEMAKI